MKRIVEAISHCTAKDNFYAEADSNCANCPYEEEDNIAFTCIDKLLIDAKEVIEAADRRMYNIEKMLTEWQMVDLRESLLREVALWHKQRGDSNE